MAHDRFQHGDERFETAPGTGQYLHSVADPMDLDFEFDLDGLSWANDLNHSLSSIGSQGAPFNGADEGAKLIFQSGGGYPLDALFLEDESTLPVFVGSGPQHGIMNFHTDQPMMSSTSLMQPILSTEHTTQDIGLQQLRHQLALLAGGSCGDELVFRDCEPSKAIALHSLTIEFGLNYTHDARNSGVSISRNHVEPLQPTRHTPTQAMDLTTKLWQEDTHLPGVKSSFAGSLVDVDDLDSLYEKFIQEPLSTQGLPSFPRYELSETYLPSASIIDISTTESKQKALKNNDGISSHLHPQGEQQLDRQPSRSERIGRSISKHVSTWKTSISKGGRRGPLTLDGRRDMKALEGAGGACWRCKVLRRKCNPGVTCRCCLQNVATPSVGEDAPLWPLIGCRRGKLRDSMVEQILCPKSRGHRKSLDSDRCDSFRSRRSVDSFSDRCLLAAESQRLADMKAVLEGASYKLSITDGDMRSDFVSFVEAGRYRNQECLYRSYEFEETTVTYAELIATIAWELAENKIVLPLMEIKSWKALMSMLETACIYEAEVGQTSLVMISMICLRQCLQALRLSSADILSASVHDDCTPGHCQVHYIRELLLGVRTYIDELSTVMFNKENMRDRRWWLSTFYSLYIQSYVRHALIAIEKQLCFPDVEDVPAEDLTSTQYLHLAGVLFTAASAKYDPLLGGQYQYALTDNSVIPETSIPELHHSSVRTACEVDKWGEVGIKSSYQFLRKLLQIGSLDFDELAQDDDSEMQDSEGCNTGHESEVGINNMGLLSLRHTTSPPVSFPESPRDTTSFYQHRRHRASFDSRYSVPSFTSMSNPSEESVARTFATDMTSIYEVSMADVIAKSTAVSSTEMNPTFEPVPGPSCIGHGVTSPPLPSVHETEGSFICGCCPKSPRSFHTVEDLIQHESEKPHLCNQPGCKMRFKSPKEAERHINAIHLKSDYWSCEALNSPMLAFHCETFSGLTYDVCGFCGGGFQRRANEDGDMDGGDSDGDGMNQAAKLVSHLDSVHKRGECNRERKFYRVDNFRQHLKTAHVAKPGKWLKILERNCKAGQGAT